MSFERYERIYYDKKQGVTLRPMKEGARFALPKARADMRYRLFVAGETGLFYLWKNEPDNPFVYRSIEDALTQDEAELSAFALSFSSERSEEYIRRVYKKILFPPRLSYLNLVPVPTDWIFGVRVKARGLEVQDGGFLRLRAAVRYLHEGVSRHSNGNEPDEVHIIDIPEGSYEYTELQKELSFGDREIASVGIFIEGKGYTGEVYFEEPIFEGNGYNLLAPFAKSIPDKDHFDWTGQYLSRKEWPSFRVLIGEKTVFEGEIFERCHRDSEWEIDLPAALMTGEEDLTVELVSSYHDPLPYTIHEIGIIESPLASFNIIAVPEAVPAGGGAAVLVMTAKDGVTIEAEYGEHVSGPEKFELGAAGLHTLIFDIDDAPAEELTVTLKEKERCERAVIHRSVMKTPDNVYTGTGDSIYVNQNKRSLEDFLCWYLSEHIGNLLTIRPTYRWSGSRTVDAPAWRELCRIMNECSMKYSHMLDGRELVGLNANPDPETLAGEGFLGRQMHERDGSLLYWQSYTRSPSLTVEQFYDMGVEIFREDPWHSNPDYDGQSLIYVVPKKKKPDNGSNPPIFNRDTANEEKMYLHKDQTIPIDMKVGHDYTVGMMRDLRVVGTTRHTGPSVAFKYFFEAGYEWSGAETMYGTLEELMAFLRGATGAWGKKDLGVHHALQWSSSPQDAPEHVRRYRLALYVSYMQGATEINTEEGLWRLEEYYSSFNRFSDACAAHAREQKDFYRYVSTHSRRGKFHTPMALMHGRYDGFNGFKRDVPWGYHGITDTDAERSWDLLSAIYPEGTLGDAIYSHNCPTDREIGFNTSTPLGNVDIIPAERSEGIIGDYRALAFMGYHCAEASDLDGLLDYARGGGRLLLSLAHLTTTTDYKAILNGKLEYLPSALGIYEGEARLEERTVNGIGVPVLIGAKAPDRVIAVTDDGTPLIGAYRTGEGEITFVLAGVYPSHPAIKELYENELRAHLRYATDAEEVAVETQDKVGSAIYKREDGSYDVYLTAVDWYRAPELTRTAVLRVGDARHTVSMKFGTMIKCCAHGKFAAYAPDESTEIISVSEDGAVTLQGEGLSSVTLITGEHSRIEQVDFSKGNLQTIKI